MTTARADSNTRLKNGDRIIFFGDSLTELGEAPKGYISLIKNVIERDHPKENIELVGAGISGDKVVDLQQRVHRDVVEKQPTLVVIFIGINDVWCSEDDPQSITPPAKFKMKLENLAALIARSGAGIVLCTPTVIGERKIGTNPLDSELDELSQIARNIARENNYSICDLRQGFVDYLNSHNDENVTSGLLTLDRVHLSDSGNALVSKLMLSTLGEKQT